MKDDLLYIIKNYGVIPQLKYFQSEVFELNEGIITYENFLEQYHSFSDPDIYYANQDLKAHIGEEIADCYVMLEQFRLYYAIPKEKIKEIMEYKVDRQLSRIVKEKE